MSWWQQVLIIIASIIILGLSGLAIVGYGIDQLLGSIDHKHVTLKQHRMMRKKK